MNKHLTTDELVDRLYGIGSNDHDCADCADRLRQLSERRTMAFETSVSREFLAAQRRNIYARMGERPQPRLKWIPALAAAAALIVVGVVSHHPAPPQVVKPDIAEAQLFSDVYSMEQSTEPQAASPIHAIFEPDQQ
jgi:2-iminoacetate synthase ThiH